MGNEGEQGQAALTQADKAEQAKAQRAEYDRMKAKQAEQSKAQRAANDLDKGR